MEHSFGLSSIPSWWRIPPHFQTYFSFTAAYGIDDTAQSQWRVVTLFKYRRWWMSRWWNSQLTFYTSISKWKCGWEKLIYCHLHAVRILQCCTHMDKDLIEIWVCGTRASLSRINSSMRVQRRDFSFFRATSHPSVVKQTDRLRMMCRHYDCNLKQLSVDVVPPLFERNRHARSNDNVWHREMSLKQSLAELTVTRAVTFIAPLWIVNNSDCKGCVGRLGFQ